MMNDPYALKEISENPIKLDFTNCRYLGEIHKILKQKFGFHDFYGENWDALRDLMIDVFSGDKNYHVEIHGYYSMNKDLQKACIKMLEVFDDVHRETPEFTYEIID